ncbi:MAG: hypothetical protein QOI10_4641, partial [Solirubrobacterales bacterium]|nr:hypothetical protein [Solirubrobacterales bacterium]
MSATNSWFETAQERLLTMRTEYDNARGIDGMAR